MSRRHSITKKIILALLISGFPLLIACDQELDFQPPENEHTKENATQDSKPTPNAPAGNPSSPPVAPSEPSTPPENADSTVTGDGNEGSAGTTDNSHAPSPDDSNPDVPGNITPPAEDTNDTSNVTPPAGGDSVSTETPLSDYEYYKQLEISRDTAEVWYKIKYLPESDEKQLLYLLKILRNEIVPQSVNVLVECFPQTFSRIENKVIGMGISFNDDSEAVVASMYSNVPTDDSTHYGLTVGYKNFAWEENHLVDNSRKELESYAVHEMMHGLMSETLSRAYFGIENYPNEDKSKCFPLWFQEGTAETVCGGARLLRKKLGQEGQQDITSEAIKEFVNKNPLKSAVSSADVISSADAAYSTGWLAVMYLGHLASGSTDINPKSIANGLDTIMSKIYGGMNLSSAIKDSCKVFEGLADFQTKFTGDNPEVVNFVVELMKAIGSGRGSVLMDDFSKDDDLLPNEEMDSALFWLCINSNNVYTNKIYGAGYPLLEGGFGN